MTAMMRIQRTIYNIYRPKQHSQRPFLTCSNMFHFHQNHVAIHWHVHQYLECFWFLFNSICQITFSCIYLPIPDISQSYFHNIIIFKSGVHSTLIQFRTNTSNIDAYCNKIIKIHTTFWMSKWATNLIKNCQNTIKMHQIQHVCSKKMMKSPGL